MSHEALLDKPDESLQPEPEEEVPADDVIDSLRKDLKASRKEYEKERDRRWAAEEPAETLSKAVAEAERKLALLELRGAGPPDDAKLAGIMQHATEALGLFFDALRELKDITAKSRERSYDIARYSKQLLESVGATMFLDTRYRPAIDDLLPAIEALHTISEMGWLSDRYGRSQAEAVEKFLALEILRRTVGLASKGKTDD